MIRVVDTPPFEKSSFSYAQSFQHSFDLNPDYLIQRKKVAQERVRYVALLLDEGAYVPAGADETWERKFGDCKGKTVLLLALLDRLGIAAEPMLISTAFDFMAANCGAGDIIHAGTYFGDFLPALSRALDPDAHLWAFEPSAENFECAQKTVALNGLGNITLMNAGLGARAETLPLRIGEPERPARGGSSCIDAARVPGFVYQEAQVGTQIFFAGA